jgi:non-specific serine/threonine protein kinase/serine/threonine-protein kinase
MTDDRWEKIGEIVHAACDLDFESQRRFVASACGSDEALFAEVISLLRQSPEPLVSPLGLASPEFMAEAVARIAAEIVGDRTDSVVSGDFASTRLKGQSFGNYAAIERISSGGMGEVWLAEQLQPVQRRVAIKLIKAGMDTSEMLLRFESERQALAIMDHPAIAKIFDAGFTSQGLPFFAMEYVPGLPVTQYCDEHRLTIAERLGLFVKICEGVEHAHQRAIIHRDLKPSNILVSAVDDRPSPRIIDFGIAKAIGGYSISDKTLTRVGSWVGSPQYMSPEQAGFREGDVDVRSDVYSLGIILYELLAGLNPFADTERSVDEALRIREDTPAPCAALRLRPDLVEIAANRKSEPAVLAKTLSGDLSWITLKALENDRDRRYRGPYELADDIGRHLSHQPVSAGPASMGYRAGKFVRRHRVGVAMAAVVALLLAVFSVVEVVQLRRITRERHRADQIRDFMTSIFRMPSPAQARGNQITAREILDRATQNIHSARDKRDPVLQSDLLDVMGGVYTDLGLNEQARSLLTEALDARQHFLGNDAPETIDTMGKLAAALRNQGKYAEAERIAREAMERSLRTRGSDHPATLHLDSLVASSLTEMGRTKEAEQLGRQAWEGQKRLLGPNDQETLVTEEHVALALWRGRHFAEAESIAGDTLARERSTLGADHPATLRTMTNLGGILDDDGKPVAAEPLLREALDTRLRILGPRHPDTVGSMNNLAVCVALKGDNSSAEELLTRIIGIQRSITGLDNPDTSMYRYNLACIKVRVGKPDEAIGLLSDLIDRPMDAAVKSQFADDPDLKPLHADPRFQNLLKRLRARAGN